MRLELIRHGETALQKEHRYQGITDAPLSPEGRGNLHPAGAGTKISPQPAKVAESWLISRRETPMLEGKREPMQKERRGR